MAIFISKEDIFYLKKISKEEVPNEAVAILTGKTNSDLFVEDLKKAKNDSPSPNSFKIDPEFLLMELEKLENTHLELVGFFHSHPNSKAYVSDRDRKYMNMWNDKLWLIGGMRNRDLIDLKGFKIENGEIIQVKIKTKNSQLEYDGK